MNEFPDSKCPQEPLRFGTCPSLASLLTLLETVPALVWETDATLRFTCLMGAALSAVAVSPKLFEGRPVWELFSAAEAPHGRKAHEAALLGQPVSFEISVNGRDLRANVRPLPGANGAIDGVIGVAMDMTEHLVLERALRLSEFGYRSLSEDAPYAICRATLGGELLQVNRAMSEMLGYDAALSPELLLRDLPLIFESPAGFEQFRKALVSRNSPASMDAQWLRRDGATIHVRVNGRVVRGAHGEISHLDIFAENVTEMKRLEAALGQAERMQAVGRLAGGVAHDFNNLLTVISGHVEMMLAESSDQTMREQLELVKQAAIKAASLTRQLLAYTRQQVLQTRNLNLNDVICRLMAMLSRLIKEDIEVVFLPGESLRCVNADPNEIERVLVNLALNAQDAMPHGGRLTIETANASFRELQTSQPDEIAPGDYARILVSDNGAGMDAETQSRAFEPFFTTKEPGQGTGLGLAVVYGVVHQSGGSIRLDSQPGVGTTFRIYLPSVTAAEAPEAAATPSSTSARQRGSGTILVAEDDAAIRNLVVHTLENLGYQVLSAADGAAAISLADSHAGEIHLLVSDLVMPALGGRQLAEALRKKSPHLKVVFISGYAGPVLGDQDLELANARFLQKPFSMDSLASAVSEALGGSSFSKATAASRLV